MDISSAYKIINAQAQANNAWSAAQAQKQMDFQLMMSNTAHQREMADLKAAGLNPILSSGGSGASVGSGAMGSTDTSNTSALMDLLMNSMVSNNTTAKGIQSLGDSVKDLSQAMIKALNSNSGTSANSRNGPTFGSTKGSVAGVPGNILDAGMAGLNDAFNGSDRRVTKEDIAGMADTYYNMLYDLGLAINNRDAKKASRIISRGLKRGNRRIHAAAQAAYSDYLEGF